MKKILLLVIVSAFGLGQVFAAPAALKFYTTNTTPKTGEIIELDLKADASSKMPIYTYVIKLEYDKDKLQFQGASYGDGFIAVTPNEVNDTQNGIIKRTAGYPNGLKKLTTVTKYKFKAIAPGKADVRITGESALDEKNVDNGLQEKKITMTVTGQPVEAEKTQIQNISLEIIGENSFDAGNIYNFYINNKLEEKVDTTATTSISLLDINGQEVLKQDKVFTANTDTKLDFNFPANTLVPGKYSLVANTVFPGQVNTSRLVQELTVTGDARKDLETLAGNSEGSVWMNIWNKILEFISSNIIVVVGLAFILFVLRFISKRVRRYKRYDR